MNANAVTADSNIVQLGQPKRRQRAQDTAKRRFKVVQFRNPSGDIVWRVTGYKRDGTRIRENFTGQTAATNRQIDLESEFMARQPEDSALRATRLSDTQIKLAEVCFLKLESDEEIVKAVDYWLQHGRSVSVSESPRIDDAATEFKAWLSATPTLRPRTKANLSLRVTMFVNGTGNSRIADIGPDTIDAYLSKRKAGPATKDNDRRALSRFFRWCMERPRAWTKVNPCRDVRVEQGEKAPPSVLSIDDCKRLLKAAEEFKDGRLVPYTAACLFGGLRPFEAGRLDWKQVNLADREIRLEANQTKTKRGRVVAISDTLSAWLAAHNGKPFFPSNWRKDFDAVKELAGFGTPDPNDEARKHLKPWPEDVMRHTAISHHFRNGGSYGLTAEWAGNSEAIIKAHYQGRVTTDDTKAFYAIMPKAKKRGAK